jgi:nicotinate-nucleotide pyrophosphorylase
MKEHNYLLVTNLAKLRAMLTISMDIVLLDSVESRTFQTAIEHLYSLHDRWEKSVSELNIEE